MEFPDRRDSDIPEWAETTMDKIQIACSDGKPNYCYHELFKMKSDIRLGPT